MPRRSHQSPPPPYVLRPLSPEASAEVQRILDAEARLRLERRLAELARPSEGNAERETDAS